MKSSSNEQSGAISKSSKIEIKWSILDEQNDFDIPDVTSQALLVLRMYSRTLEKALYPRFPT